MSLRPFWHNTVDMTSCPNGQLIRTSTLNQLDQYAGILSIHISQNNLFNIQWLPFDRIMFFTSFFLHVSDVVIIPAFRSGYLL